MKCKLPIKTTENERGIWGFEFGLTEMCSLLISRASGMRERQTLFYEGEISISDKWFYEGT